MKCDRLNVLNNFLKSEKFKEITGLTDDEIQDFNIGSESSNILVEALKKLIISYCNDDSEIVVLRNVNARINL